MDQVDHPGMVSRHEARSRRARGPLLLGSALTIAIAVGAFIGIRGMYAQTSATISVSPQSVGRIWYKPTPINITINASNFSGPGQTPISGYQYALQYNPKELQWVSGPDVGPGTPTVQPILPCLQSIFTGVTATPWPTGFVPTYTPTNTVTATPTSTPGLNTPTDTPTVTLTPSITPTFTPTITPAGYIAVACASLSQSTPIPNGVIGSFTFKPIATAAGGSALNLINVATTDFYGATVVPVTTAISGDVILANCYDMNGDGVVNILDLSIVAAHYDARVGDSNYVAAYDVNSDGIINILDLSAVAAGYHQTC